MIGHQFPRYEILAQEREKSPAKENSPALRSLTKYSLRVHDKIKQELAYQILTLLTKFDYGSQYKI